VEAHEDPGAVSSVLRYYEACFARHGDTARGAGWPNEPDRLLRFDVVLELVEWMVPAGPVVLCDLGCGTGELLRRIQSRRLDRIAYAGIDALGEPLAMARSKFPGVRFEQFDVSTAASEAGERLSCDVAVANGLFTVKGRNSHEEMWELMTSVLERVWPVARRGVIFNVMSPIVDRERDDLFHVSYDRLAAFLHALAGRSIGFRADYGLYEYMAYATKTPHNPAIGPL
jgi:SAM-dependent methyltransferase